MSPPPPPPPPPHNTCNSNHVTSSTPAIATTITALAPSTQTPSKNIKLKIINKKKSVNNKGIDVASSATPPTTPSKAFGSKTPHTPMSSSLPKHKKGTLLNNHLLGFEFSPPSSFKERQPTGRAGGGGSYTNITTTTKSTNTNNTITTSLTRDQYILSSFRFITKSQNRPERDEMLDWNLIEAVIQPCTSAHSCTICLNSPLLSPRLLRCGHIFCLPCLIRYKDSSGGKNWNPCPICFEFVDLEDYKLVLPELISEPSETLKMTLISGDGDVETFTNVIDDDNGVSGGGVISKSTNPFNRITTQSAEEIDLLILKEEKEHLSKHLLFSQIDPQEDPLHTDCLQKSMESLRMTKQKLYSNNNFGVCTGVNVVCAVKQPLKQKQQQKQQKPSQLFFHQCFDGQNIFLCPLNIKMLKEEYGEYHQMPSTLQAPILEMSAQGRVDEAKRRRLKFLNRLPIGAQFSLVELDLTSLVSREILKKYNFQLERLCNARQARGEEDDRRAKRFEEELYASGVENDHRYLCTVIRSQTCREQLVISSYEENFPSFGERRTKAVGGDRSGGGSSGSINRITQKTSFANVATSLPNLTAIPPSAPPSHNHQLMHTPTKQEPRSSSSLSSIDLSDADNDDDNVFALSLDDLKT